MARSARWIRWLLVPLVVLCMVALVWVHHRLLTYPDRYVDRDFMTLWCGGRAMLEGLDPYDPEVWIPLRRRFGSSWMPNPTAPYPIWTCLLMVPFSALSLDWSAAAWLVFSELLVGLCCLALMTQFGSCRPSIGGFLLIALVAFLFRGTITSLINGQLTIVLLGVLTLFLVLMVRQRPFLAGLAFSLLALKPSVFVLFVPLVVFWLAIRRHWRVIAGMGVGGLVLLSLGWWIRPDWLLKWLSVRVKTEATFKTPTVWGVAYDLSPAWWPALGLALTVGITVVLGWIVFTGRGLNIPQVVSLALSGSLAVTPYVWSYEHALLLIPLLLLYVGVSERWLGRLLWVALCFALPWSLYWVATQLDRDTMSFLVPTLVGGGALAVFPWLHRSDRSGVRLVERP